MAAPVPAYSFDNDDPEAVARHTYLAEILDPTTFARLAGLGDLVGRRCLEVGAGGGSVARWLAARVGPHGEVLATDLNPRHLPAGAGYRVLRHDLVTEPVPAGPSDVIRARLVLLHLPSARRCWPACAACCAPAVPSYPGVGHRVGSLVLAAPSQADADLVDAYQETLVRKILPAPGNDPMWRGPGARGHDRRRA